MKQIELHPNDEYNQSLVAHTHPPDWNNPEPAPRYTVLVVGGGPAGLVAASIGAALGAKITLVEKHLLGGDCLNVGCVPSKTLIRSSRAVASIREASQFGISVSSDVQVDFHAVMERMRQIRSHIAEHDSAKRFTEMGIDVFFGSGQFSGTNTFEINGKTLRFKKAIIATGARAAVPPIDGLSESGFLTNETVFSLTDRPNRLAVLGGGPIGCELAQTFARLGVEVHLFDILPRLLPRDDCEAAQVIAETMRKEGVQLHLGSKVQRVTHSESGKEIHFQNGNQNKTVMVDEILVAAGRAPNVEDLNLEAANVTYNTKSGIQINDSFRTSNSSIFAIGDVCMTHKFTHAADAAARLAIQNALFGLRKKAGSLTIPWCTYTDPEVAHVGITEAEARNAGLEIDVYTQSLQDIDRAKTDGETEGFVKIITQKDTGKILGATIVTRHAGEMINEITMAMLNQISLGSLSNVIHPYPTKAEAIRKIGDQFNRKRLTPFRKKIMHFIMKILG